ncbi:MAG: glutamate-5-semialdehyde dehydrogenase [Clostridia bacterium]|nr:glutamate-5-semialdehyde dehydrogenase [Clostridia bacterium]
MYNLTETGARAKNAAGSLAKLSTPAKNAALHAMADEILNCSEEILAANAEDVIAARQKGTPEPMIDRLALSEARIAGMAKGIRDVAALPDPVGALLSGETLANGLRIEKRTVPFGVIGIIYEARPNVTGDAAALCFKAGSACILRGGSEAIRSNMAITRAMRRGLEKAGIDPDAVILVEDTSRETANALMKLNAYLDLLIPRGGAGLIRSVVENATVPVIETGTGNCHAYVEKSANIDMAAEIVFNGKTSRPSVCNALENLLVDEAIAEKALPAIAAKLREKGVEIRGCERTCAILPDALPASGADYATEFLDYIIAVKVVSGIEEAIAHIAKYSTHHSEAIITNDYAAAERFANEVDSAAVYVNASTRFTDGGEFGLGAEIGISTQKLHARGPMGLNQLVSHKYVIRGNGQVRV